MRTGSSTNAGETWRSTLRLEIAPAAEGIDEGAVRRLRDGVDGQVAPREILLERDFGPEFDREAAIARRTLALEARQRIFLVGLADAGTPESRGPLRDISSRSSSSRVPPTTTQSRSLTGKPSRASRTAPPTRYTCMREY